MAASIDTITNEGGARWRFEISGTQPFRWFLDGERIAFDNDDEDGASPTTDRIIEGEDTEEPPAVEILDSTETQTPENLLNPMRVKIQWRGVTGTDVYIISRKVDGIFTQIKAVGHDERRGYYQYQTPIYDNGTETFRIVADDGRGNTSTPLDYDVFIVRNPAPPSISASYSPVTGDLTISSRG